MSRFILQNEASQPKAILWLERDDEGQLYLKSRPTANPHETWCILRITEDGTIELCDVIPDCGFETELHPEGTYVAVTREGLMEGLNE